jgi:hypothetical protein
VPLASAIETPLLQEVETFCKGSFISRYPKQDAHLRHLSPPPQIRDVRRMSVGAVTDPFSMCSLFLGKSVSLRLPISGWPPAVDHELAYVARFISL